MTRQPDLVPKKIHGRPDARPLEVRVDMALADPVNKKVPINERVGIQSSGAIPCPRPHWRAWPCASSTATCVFRSPQAHSLPMRSQCTSARSYS
jgi:hypothetical protein